jgi:hypothetical protein
LAELPLARAVAGTDSIAAAHDVLTRLGMTTELDYELRRAAGG